MKFPDNVLRRKGGSHLASKHEHRIDVQRGKQHANIEVSNVQRGHGPLNGGAAEAHHPRESVLPSLASVGARMFTDAKAGHQTDHEVAENANGIGFPELGPACGDAARQTCVVDLHGVALHNPPPNSTINGPAKAGDFTMSDREVAPILPIATEIERNAYVTRPAAKSCSQLCPETITLTTASQRNTGAPNRRDGATLHGPPA